MKRVDLMLSVLFTIKFKLFPLIKLKRTELYTYRVTNI